MNRKKRAFTLVEMLISIVLFAVIVTFVYNSLDDTKQTNQFIKNKLTTINEYSRYKSIIMEDIIESSKIEIRYDSNGNSILYLTTTNSYHNLFFKNVVYFITGNNNLVRIESDKSFKNNLINDMKYIKDYYIDEILNNVEKFKIAKVMNENGFYSIVLKQEEQSLKVMNIKAFRN